LRFVVGLVFLVEWVAVSGCFLGGASGRGPLILNEGVPVERVRRETETAIPAQLRRIANRLVAEFVEGKKVDYEGLRHSDAFREYRELTRQLNDFDLKTLDTREKQLAFWVNLYNALVMDSVLASGVERSVRERAGFFDRYAYRIGGFVFTPNDIEHGILRGVSIPPEDPRFPYVLARLDPRIHFALNCASAGCPPIAAYDADEIDAQLDLATSAFINSPSEVALDRETFTLRLSPLFDWYRTDFGFAEDAVLRFIESYLADADAKAFLAAHRKDLRLVYNEYDWSLNHR